MDRPQPRRKGLSGTLNGRRNGHPTRGFRIRHKDKTYSLRGSEIATMTDIGRFRTVDVRDLSRHSPMATMRVG